jgi:hypothetical protein
MQSMRGLKFYVLFYGTIVLLWTAVILSGLARHHLHH